MTSATDETPPGIPAATVIVFRQPDRAAPPELLLLERAGSMRFAGGATVFPGGRIDPADRTLAARLMPDADPDLAAAQICAIRETLEETGLALAPGKRVDIAEARDARAMLLEQGELAPVLERFGWRLDPGALVPFARWYPGNPRMFDTHFFLADLGTGAVDLAVDATENSHLFWASAAQALAMADNGAISVIYPTQRNLERLALYGDFEQARAHALAHPPRMITPWVEMHEGEEHLTIRDDCGYPVIRESLATAKRAMRH